jgi:uncharacterized protein (TIGR02147 family)
MIYIFNQVKTMQPIVYTYLDYRHYLGDLFSSLKKESSGISYRAFAKMAGSTSPNFLQLILSRKLNIQPSGVLALSQSIKLSIKERRYFEFLAAFDHAKTHDEKDRYFRLILLAREYKEIQTLDRKQYELFSHWFIPVIRELVTSPLYTGDPAWIGERIIPAVSPAKVKKGIALLSSLDLIRQNENKTWEQTGKVVSTPSEVLSVAITTYHKDMLTIAREAIERFKPEDRDVRSVTLGISPEGYSEIKQRVGAFWKEILSFAETQKSVDRIYQVNMQLFPLSEKTEERP